MGTTDLSVGFHRKSIDHSNVVLKKSYGMKNGFTMDLFVVKLRGRVPPSAILSIYYNNNIMQDITESRNPFPFTPSGL
jgi:hypothetical protein